MDRNELGGWLRLTLSTGVGNASARRLLSRFGLPQAIFEQTEAVLAQTVTAAQARALVEVPQTWAELLETTCRWLQSADADSGIGRAVVTLGDARYPRALLETEDPPLVLYVMGASRWLAQEFIPQGQCLAIVGSRNPTAQGAENARQFAQALAKAGLTIISGLALGVDAAAHEGALQVSTSDAWPGTPPTMAVVGTGLDRVYPRKNLDLAHRIAASGLLISEYPLGTPALASNFPKRNRIISGLSQGTLVVEAALASGSLITARTALEQGRDVFAIPGSIHSPQSRGCHALIRQGAKLVETAQDVLEELPVATPLAADHGANAAKACQPADSGTPDDDLLAALGFDPMGIDALLARTGLDAATLQVRLLTLELEGRVARLAGGLFQRLERV